MSLSIVSIDNMSKILFWQKARCLFKSSNVVSIKKLGNTFFSEKYGIYFFILDRGILINSYSNSPEQKEFISQCISKLFDGKRVAVSGSACEWLSKENPIQNVKIYELSIEKNGEIL